MKKIKSILIFLIIFSLFNNFFMISNFIDARILIVIYIIFNLVCNKGRIVINKLDRFSWIISTFFVIFIAQILISILRYNVNPWVTLKANSYIIMLLLYYVLCDFFNELKNGYKNFILCLTIYSIMFSIILLIQQYIYIKYRIIFLNIEDIINFRNGILRLSCNDAIIHMSTLFSIGYFFAENNKKIKFIHLLNIMIGTFAIFYVIQTRMMLIITMIIGVSTLWKYNYKNSKQKIFSKILCIFSTVLLIISLRNEHIYKYVQVNSQEGSIYARIGGYIYYIKEIILNPLMGLSGVINENIFGLAKKFHGPQEIYYFSDVGIIGTTAKLGIIAGIIYVYTIILTIKKAYFYENNKDIICKNISLLILCYSLTLSMLDNYRIFMFPICFAVFKFESCKNNT